MDRSFDFRRTLSRRLVGISLLAAPWVVAASVGCGQSVTTSGQGGSGGSTGSIDPSTGAGSYTAESCFPWPQGTGGAGGVMNGAGGAGAMGGMGGMGGAGGAEPPVCPSKDDALQYLTDPWCSATVQTEGTFQDGQCCYTVLYLDCGVGRPYLAEGQAVTAKPSREHRAWIEPSALAPVLEGLSSEQRAALASAWQRDGLFEHASVASFGRFALELLSVGAPPDLIDLAHRAALDEVRHARLALSLASAYAGQAIAPAPFPFEGRVEVSSSLADIAARVVKEGCVGETLASVLAAEQLAAAKDPAVRAALSQIAEDEARHAELAFRTVAWAIRTGGDEVRRAVAAAFEEASREAPHFEAGPEDEVFAAHGRPGRAAVQRALAQAMIDVVRPAMAALLGEG